jgi:hypothetical protein
VPTTNDYAALIVVKVLPQISKLLIYLKEENTNAVLFKIESAQDENFVDAEELQAETLLAKNGHSSKTVNDSWLYVRVLHKAAVAGVQGKTSCIISGSGGRNITVFVPYNGKIADIIEDDTDKHFLNLEIALGETRKIVAVMLVAARMDGGGSFLVYPNEGVTNIQGIQGQGETWNFYMGLCVIKENSQRLQYSQLWANDDWDLYCLGYVVET